MSELAERTLGKEKIAIQVAGWAFWEWFIEHKADVVVRRKVLGLFTVTITVEQLRPLFVRIFGEPQQGV